MVHRYPTMRLLCLLIIYSVCVSGAISQSTEKADTPPIDTNVTSVDTIVERRNGILDVFEGNPGTAAIRGLLIPAGGQIYNKRWWKVPLALGVEASTIYYLIYSYGRFEYWDENYILVKDSPPGTVITDPELIRGLTPELVLKKRNSWRSQKEMAWVYFAIGHIFTAFEAYIDRHLIEFDVSDDLTFTPIQVGLGIYPAVNYTIPLHTSRYQTKPPLTVLP